MAPQKASSSATTSDVASDGATMSRGVRRKDPSNCEPAVPDDDLTSEERAELHASLDRALAQSEEGLGVDVWEYLARYKRFPRAISRTSTAARTRTATAGRALSVRDAV